MTKTIGQETSAMNKALESAGGSVSELFGQMIIVNPPNDGNTETFSFDAKGVSEAWELVRTIRDSVEACVK